MYQIDTTMSGACVSDTLRTAHIKAWQSIAQAGDFYTGSQRVEFVRIAREALACDYCQRRKSAISPNAVDGQHECDAAVDPIVIDLIHRVRTDPGRLTNSWFDHVIQVITKQQYVEIISVVASAVIIDTLHNALGLGVPALPKPKQGKARRQYNQKAVDGGAWLPMLAVPHSTTEQKADNRLPQVPNIARALGLVPSALDLFFSTFRPHYALRDIPLSISQGQAEFVAARVSALNECFY